MFSSLTSVVISSATPSKLRSTSTLTVSRHRALWSTVGILDRVGHQQPPLVIERDVHWLIDRRLAGEKLNLETRRQVKLRLLFGRRKRLARRHQRRLGRDPIGSHRERGTRTPLDKSRESSQLLKRQGRGRRRLALAIWLAKTPARTPVSPS